DTWNLKPGTWNLSGRDATEVKSEELSRIRPERRGGVGLPWRDARESLRVHPDGQVLRLTEVRLDEQSNRHRVKQDRRGPVPKVVEDGQAVGQSGEVSEHPMASRGTQLEHGGRVERRHQDRNARAKHGLSGFGIGGDVVLGGGLEGLAVAV